MIDLAMRRIHVCAENNAACVKSFPHVSGKTTDKYNMGSDERSHKGEPMKIKSSELVYWIVVTLVVLFSLVAFSVLFCSIAQVSTIILKGG
jgi:hypothetical protein